MSLRTKFLLAAAGLAIFLAGIFFGSPGHVFWPSSVSGLLISPMRASLSGYGWDESSKPRRSLFEDSDHAFLNDDSPSDPFGYEPSSEWRSADVHHISNGGPNVFEWSAL